MRRWVTSFNPGGRGVLLGLPFVFLSIASIHAGTARVERRLGVMGTTLSIVVEAVDRPAALAASERAVRALEAAEARLSTWREDTELARLNRAAAGAPVRLSPELAAELAAAQHWRQETGGAFDPGIGALVEAWGLRSGGRIPEVAERQAALASGGLTALKLEGAVAVRTHPALRIEEGGFGKGAGLDEALAALDAEGVLFATLDLGGQIAVLDRGSRVSFGVADPRQRNRPVLRVDIERGSVATSGNSERGIEVAGVRYSHILDPRCGTPAPDFGSLTVWAPDALTADCLSTGLYVLGPDAALAWATAHPGIEALVLETTPGGLRARATLGFEGRLSILAQNVLVKYYEGH